MTRPAAHKLRVEVNKDVVIDATVCGQAMIMTSEVFANWIARVPLADGQALVAFRKFGTVGIGFEKETDWNTNLPYSCSATEIYDHIKHNKGSVRITRKQCLVGIEALREIGAKYLGRPYEAT